MISWDDRNNGSYLQHILCVYLGHVNTCDGQSDNFWTQLLSRIRGICEFLSNSKRYPNHLYSLNFVKDQEYWLNLDQTLFSYIFLLLKIIYMIWNMKETDKTFPPIMIHSLFLSSQLEPIILSTTKEDKFPFHAKFGS